MKCSCIDIGSNTIKVSVFEKHGMHWKNTAFLGEQTGLVRYLEQSGENKILNRDGVDALCNALKKLVEFSNKNGTDKIFAFATAALRGAENIHDIKKRVFDEVGIHFEVISAEEEALCSLRGMLLDERCEGVKEGVMIDMGGGSVEVVHFVNGKEPTITSLPFGCLSLTQKFVSGERLLPSDRQKLADYVKPQLKACAFVHNLKCPVFLIGGTARATLKLIEHYKGKKQNIYKPSDFKLACDMAVGDDNFVSVCRKLIPKRVHTIAAGSTAMYELLSFIGSTEVYFSDSGVREGYLERILM